MERNRNLALADKRDGLVQTNRAYNPVRYSATAATLTISPGTASVAHPLKHSRGLGVAVSTCQLFWRLLALSLSPGPSQLFQASSPPVSPAPSLVIAPIGALLVFAETWLVSSFSTSFWSSFEGDRLALREGFAVARFMTPSVASRTQKRGNVLVTNGHQNGHQPPSTAVNLIAAYLPEKMGVM